jgi:hypothetical protein
LKSKFLNCWNAKFLCFHGAIFFASNAASIAIVPEPQNGSINGLLNFHHESRIIAAARFSFKGAGPV